MERVVHGTKICEGNVWQHLIFETVRDSGAFTVVEEERRVPLNPENRNHRQTHRVDIWCQDDINHRIFAFNSKGKSFNNTESQESLLAEYNTYKRAIELGWPDYSIVYAVLKDEYNSSDPKMGKYHFLTENGIPVYNTAEYLQTQFGLSSQAIEAKRRTKVIEILRQRMVAAGISMEDLCQLMTETSNTSTNTTSLAIEEEPIA